jgi:hypothetical protein
VISKTSPETAACSYGEFGFVALPLRFNSNRDGRSRQLDGMASLDAGYMAARMLPWAWCRSGEIDRFRLAGQKHGLKVKNRKHPAMERVKESFSCGVFSRMPSPARFTISDRSYGHADTEDSNRLRLSLAGDQTLL